MSTPTGATVLHKELNGFPNYGVVDSAADIVYEGNVERWTFQVPTGAFVSAKLALSLSADDHGSGAATSYRFDVWTNQECVAGNEGALTYGAPFAAQFNSWKEVDFPISVLPGQQLVVTLMNRSTTGGSTNWIGVDWVELRMFGP